MIKKYLYCVLFFMIFSCQSLYEEPRPESFIEEDKMVEILADIAFVKSAKTSFRKVLESEKINPEAYILKKHNIDSAVFAQNNRWYANTLEKYSKLITRVKDTLVASRIMFEELKKEEDSIKKAKQDSIRKRLQDSIKMGKDTLKHKKILDSLKEKFEEEEEEWVH